MKVTKCGICLTGVSIIIASIYYNKYCLAKKAKKGNVNNYN